MKRKYLIVLMFLSCALGVIAQNNKISGVVKDATGAPLVGANVYEKGTTRGVSVDTDGKFEITYSSANSVIVVSYLGYQSKEFKVAEILKSGPEGKGIDGQLDVELLEGTNLSTIEVVGSRANGRSIIESAVPIDVIDIQQITARTGQLDLNQLLQFVAPSFNSNRQTGSDGADHVDPASLRGLGPDQTLVLINGKRRHQSALVNLFGTRGRGNTGTDLNAIPVAAIERVEILRDGAAAQYGSDAIAGVINIVLKSTTNEISINANAGTYEAKYRFDNKRFDGLNTNINANYGFKIGKDGFVNLTGDYNYRDHTNRANTNPGDLARREFGDPKIQNASLFLNAQLPLNEKTQLYAFGGSNYRKGDAYAWTRFFDDDRNVPSIYPNGFDPNISTIITDNAITGGVKRLFGKWDMDLYNTYGVNNFHYYVNNSLNVSLGASSPTSFDAGGFGLSQNNTGIKFNRYFKKVFSGLNLAMGSEYRIESYNIFKGEEKSYANYDATLASGSQGFPGFSPTDVIKKSRSNFGAFVDAEVDVTNRFMVSGAVRFERYSDFGGTLNGKLAARFKITNNISVRASASTGFRAPSLAQINFNSTFTNFIAGQPVDVLLARNNSAVTQALGIPPLKQETSQNFSLGFTAAPIHDLSITADVYVVNVKDRIVLTGQFADDDPQIGTLLQNLNVGKAQFFTNALSTYTRGLDVVVAYSPRVGNGRLSASVAANFNDLRLGSVVTSGLLAGKEDTYFDLREQYFVKASAPPSKINATVDYAIGKFNFLIRVVHFGKVTLANWNYDTNALDVYKDKFTTDVSFKYTILPNFSATIGCQNLFNEYPSKSAPSLTESGGAWDPVQMGFNGRYFFARLNYKIQTKKS